MEYQKITNLLSTTIDEIPRFITKKWVEVHDHKGSANDRYKPNKQIRFTISILRSDLCDDFDVYIIVKKRPLAFKNNAPFTNCISKINNVLNVNAEDLDVVMPMYNLIEYSKNYRKTIGCLWNYYRDELSDDTIDNNNLDKNVINSESFKYKTSITGSTYNVNERITNAGGNQVNNPNYNADQSGEKKKIVAPLKCLGDFWKSLDTPLIDCKLTLTLTWSENCVITSLERREITYTRRDSSPKNATFKKQTQNYMCQLLLYQQRMIIIF